MTLQLNSIGDITTTQMVGSSIAVFIVSKKLIFCYNNMDLLIQFLLEITPGNGDVESTMTMAPRVTDRRSNH